MLRGKEAVMFSLSKIWQWLRLHWLVRGFAGSIAFLAAVVPAWPHVASHFWPETFTVYVLHGEDNHGQSVWKEFDLGVDAYLGQAGKNTKINGHEAVAGDYRLRVRRVTWSDAKELEQKLDRDLKSAFGERSTLAVIAATNSQYAETILSRLDPDDPPVVLLSAATKNDLLLDPRGSEPGQALPRAFRMVPKNEVQAKRLAAVIRKAGEESGRVGVAILRIEGENAAFSRDMAQQLRRELETNESGMRRVDVLVDAAIDSSPVIPLEFMELRPDYIVFIGSHSATGPLVLQTLRLQEKLDAADGYAPRFLLTDAGMLGNFAAFGDEINRIEGTLPLKEAIAEGGERFSYRSLGFDGMRLLYEAVENLPKYPHLDRQVLAEALGRQAVDGTAQSYSFDGGENISADFHLWRHAASGWMHDTDRCSSRFD
jgi:ABC-type branched-subunit amino acid transport system substrate-binding protein